MDARSVALYLRALDSGSEPTYRVRLMLTGPYGVGKTCIARRMLAQDIVGVESTNGIDVHVGQCRAGVLDNSWSVGQG
jgi:hypothetical protein